MLHQKRFVVRKLRLNVKQNKNDTIQPDIFNKDFYNMVNTQKNQALWYIFLINQKSNEKIVTKYKIHNKIIS